MDAEGEIELHSNKDGVVSSLKPEEIMERIKKKKAERKKSNTRKKKNRNEGIFEHIEL